LRGGDARQRAPGSASLWARLLGNRNSQARSTRTPQRQSIARRRPARAHDPRGEARADHDIWTQKNEVLDAAGRFDPAKARKLYPAGIGHFARPNDLRGLGNPVDHPFRDERQTVDLVNAIQRYNLRRRGSPYRLFHEESLHGYAARGATSFPQAIALASSWDPELLTRVFTVAAREVRARGVQLVLAPVVDVARDPRWGRIEETYGEDRTWSARWASRRSAASRAMSCRWVPATYSRHSNT